MASLKPRRGKWFSRIRWYEVNNPNQQEKQIPLRTSDKTVAHKRNREVSRYEKDIINGIDFNFSWMKDGGKTEVKELTLIEALTDWIERRKKQPDIRKATVQINENSIDHL